MAPECLFRRYKKAMSLHSGHPIRGSAERFRCDFPANGFHPSSKFTLEGLTEALWQAIEPSG
jgi:hypothetical protein